MKSSALISLSCGLTSSNEQSSAEISPIKLPEALEGCLYFRPSYRQFLTPEDLPQGKQFDMLMAACLQDATQPGEFSQTEEVGKPHETESIEVTASPGMPSSCTSSGPEEFQIQSAVPASTIEARSKSLKSDYCQTPGRLVAPPPCLRSGGSPFASPPAQLPTDSAHPLDTELGGIPRTKERQPAANKFMGTRQPSLQEWCADAELLPTRSKSVQAQATQSFELTPHGSPKLTRPGLPIFTPRAPKKSGRRSFAYGQMPLPASRADALSDLLSCDEDLGWSWRSLEQPEREDQAFQKYGMNGAPDHAGSSFDSHSMKLLS